MPAARRKDDQNDDGPTTTTPTFRKPSASHDAPRADSAARRSDDGSRPPALKASTPLVPASAPATPSAPLPNDSEHPAGGIDQLTQVTTCQSDDPSETNSEDDAPSAQAGRQVPPGTSRYLHVQPDAGRQVPPRTQSIRGRYRQFCAAKELAYRPLDSVMDLLRTPGADEDPPAAQTTSRSDSMDSQQGADASSPTPGIGGGRGGGRGGGGGGGGRGGGGRALLPQDPPEPPPGAGQWSFPPARVDFADLHAPRPPRKRGVTVRWLEEFSKRCCEYFQGSDFTASDVMLDLVDPARELHGCPVAYLPNVEIAEPDAMLLFAWDRPFLETVDAARDRFRGSPDSAVWMELFALDDSMGALQQVNALPGIVAHVPHVLGAVDPAGSLLSDPWFLLSAFHAGQASKLQLLTGSVAPRDAPDVAGAIALASLSRSMATGSSRRLLTAALQQQQRGEKPDRMGGALPAASKVDRALPEMLLAAMGSLEPFYSASISRNLRPPCSLEVSAAAEVRVAILREAGDLDRAEELLDKIASMRAGKLGDTHELVRGFLHPSSPSSSSRSFLHTPPPPPCCCSSSSFSPLPPPPPPPPDSPPLHPPPAAPPPLPPPPPPPPPPPRFPPLCSFCSSSAPSSFPFPSCCSIPSAPPPLHDLPVAPLRPSTRLPGWRGASLTSQTS